MKDEALWSRTARSATAHDARVIAHTHSSGMAWLWPALVALTAVAGSLANRNAPSLYGTLDQPSWAPPSSWFAPVWTVLYILMAAGAWLIARSPASPQRRLALQLFFAHLVANGLWSWLYFAWHQGGLAFADIIVMWVLLAAAAWVGRRAHAVGAALWVPTLAWVAFAGALNLSTWLRNPEILG